MPAERGHSLAVLADVHDRRGEAEAAGEHRGSAHALFARIGHTWWAGRTSGRAPSTAAALSPGELAVVEVVARGATNREAAAALYLSVRTVESHLARVYRKLGIRSRTELIRSRGGR